MEVIKIYFFPTFMTYIILLASSLFPHFFQQSSIFLLGLFSFPHFIISYYLWWTHHKRGKFDILVWLFPLLFWPFIFYVNSRPELQSLLNYLIQFSYLYLIYHFLRQFYGVIVWQYNQQNIFVSNLKKKFINFFLLSIGLFSWAILQNKSQSMVLFYYKVDNFFFPSEVVTLFFFIALFAFCLFFIYDFVDWFRKKHSLAFFLPYLTILSALLWFYPGLVNNATWFMLIPILHAVQYIPFWYQKLNLSLRGKKLYLLYSLSFLCGILAFRELPLKLNDFMKNDIGYMAMILFLNLHHFIIDGFIWKRKDNRELFPKGA